MRALVLTAGLVLGCAGPGAKKTVVADLAEPLDLGGPKDAGARADQGTPHDLSAAMDDAGPDDASTMDDLRAPPPDLRKPPPDLLRFDLRMPPPDIAGADLAQKPDLRMPPADFAWGDLALGCTVKLNEVQTAGVTADDEFIELYNPCADAVDLSGYKLLYRSSVGVFDVTLVSFAMVSVPSLGYLVIGQNNYAGMSDVKYASAISATGGGLGLRHPNGVLVDAVGWGNAMNAYTEKLAAPAPVASKTIERIPDGTDTDDNSKDFTVGANPTPHAANK